MIEIDSRIRSFRDVLKVICGLEILDEFHLTMPELTLAHGVSGDRPEYRWFELQEASMEAGKEMISRSRMPMVYAFGQTGYGRPGYNMISDEWDFYYMVGAGIRWNIWDWNSSTRERQVLEQQQQQLHNRKATFNREIQSQSIQEEAKIKQFRNTMKLEREVLKLQKEISENAAAKLASGTITATEYITELNRESLARINLSTHEIQLMQAIANYMTILGNL
jgi:outer membrane protein TolC